MMNWNRPPYWKAGDVEDGGASRPLYPMMLESPELRWAFVRKIYTILSLQILLTVAVAAVVVSVKPISRFFVSSGGGLAVYIFLIILPFIGLKTYGIFRLFCLVSSLIYDRRLTSLSTFSDVPSILLLPAPPDKPLSSRRLYCFHQLCCGIDMRVYQRTGKVILESAILTTVVVVSLTLYTFWAAKKGHDFSFLGPFLFAAVMILLVFSIIQIFFPLGRISYMIYGGLASLIFCGYIIFDTDNLIKRYAYDEYVWAAVALYLDIINLFLSLLTLFRAADNS
ncbi:BI1-like protein [Apostasia shenzhenica]|uniref:BI1-like protein n=1 Tax=Apostasia shenzhenica TaxID=1088818 RepID=A0A2I0A1F6_9ASPA|nr:BI1-like protein [Apostasia shenzhenica]